MNFVTRFRPSFGTMSASGVRKCFQYFVLTGMLFCIGLRSTATVWTTGTAGAINTLANWTDGAVSPSSFTTPGDTWNITAAMTLPSSGAWVVGGASTVNFAPGGVLSMSGAGSTFTITINGDLNFTGGTLSLGGAGTTANVTVSGNTTVTSGAINSIASTTILNMILNGLTSISGGSIATSGASSEINWNSNGAFSMTGGSFVAGGAGADILLNIKANASFSGPCAMTSTGAGTTSNVHFVSLPTIITVNNTSTGTWSGTNIYVDAGCTAQLDDNFSTTTGAAAFGLTVNGTLMCPAAYVVNGTRKFTVSNLATLVVASPAGINGAITTTGTKTFSTSANYNYSGSVAQVTGDYLPVSLVSPSVLTINNSAGVTLTQTTQTTGSLAFMAGILNTGAYTITTPGTAAAVTGAGATKYVNGNLIKTISGLTAINYEVGDINYAPMNLTLSTAGTSGNIGVTVKNGLHPNVATSGLLSTNMANHYWTISNYSAAGPTTITPMATYNSVDIIGGSNTAFQTQKFSGGAWLGTFLATANMVSPYTSMPVSGVSLATVAGDYIFGNAPCGTSPITGTATVCVGATTTLANATAGGTWSSVTPSVATVSTTGVVTGVSGGTTTISYTVGTCPATIVVTVNDLPVAGPITGVNSACIGLTTTLTGGTPGGTWTSASPAIATVSSTGVVTGVAAGSAVVSYTVTNLCGTATATINVTVSTTLYIAPITGVDSVCPAHTDTLYCATGGGTWTSTNTTIATVSATGVVTGVAPGYDTIVYTVTNSCGTDTVQFRIKVRTVAACAASVAGLDAGDGILNIMPNPNNGSFSVRLSLATEETMNIVITDVTGRQVYQLSGKTNTSAQVQLNPDFAVGKNLTR